MRWTAESLVDDVLVLPDDTGAASVCHEHTIPAFVEEQIEHRYGSLFSALPHLLHTGKLGITTSTYVQHKEGQVQTLLLFDRNDRRVTVLNELICLSREETATFAAFVFARYPSVSTISLNAVSADLSRLPYPSQRYFCSEDIVIGPLAGFDDYTQSLKKSTRKSIRRHGNALLRAWPSATFSVLSTQAITAPLVRQIIGFNKARMANKERVSAYTETESEWIVAMARARGLAITITIGGRLCGGAVCCNIGGRFFLLVTAHDPEFDQFGLGMLCSHRVVSECIARGATEVHLLWGRLPYKTDLGGIPRRFDRITIYRSHAAWLRCPDKAMLAAITGLARELRLWLTNAEGQPTVQGRLANLLWRCARRAKHTTKSGVNVLRRMTA
jgi:hypothetical protein